jgi:hypothetical protein
MEARVREGSFSSSEAIHQASAQILGFARIREIVAIDYSLQRK